MRGFSPILLNIACDAVDIFSHGLSVLVPAISDYSKKNKNIL